MFTTSQQPTKGCTNFRISRKNNTEQLPLVVIIASSVITSYLLPLFCAAVLLKSSTVSLVILFGFVLVFVYVQARIRTLSLRTCVFILLYIHSRKQSKKIDEGSKNQRTQPQSFLLALKFRSNLTFLLI